MKFERKHNILLRLLGFAFLLALMVILNGNQNSKNDAHDAREETEQVANNSVSGLSAVPFELPKESPRSLPIRLISNPKMGFTELQNCNYNQMVCKGFKVQKKRFVEISPILQKLLIQYITSLANKDIQ